jgi:serine protease Do
MRALNLSVVTDASSPILTQAFAQAQHSAPRSAVGRMASMDCSTMTSARRVWVVIQLALMAVGLWSPPASADSDQIAAIVERVSPAVVRVVTVRPPPHDQARPDDKVATAANDGSTTAFGSGYIIDPSGYVGTNRHVVEGASSVFVVTSDGVRHAAEIVGMPSEADIALLRIDAGAQPLPYVQLGDSDKMHVGDPVFAIGSPFGFDNTVTAGIISGVNRNIMESPFDDYLQTDAAINHGNSGGPLFNMDGEVIGMNSVIYSPVAAFAGLAFAIPSSSLRFVFDRLMKTGEIQAGMLPIHTQEVTWMLQQALDVPEPHGALVTSVQDDAGKMLQGKILAGDVIRVFNGETVLDPRDLARMAARTPIGSDVPLEICRRGAKEIVNVTIHAWPETKPAILNNDGPRTLGLVLVSARDDSGQPIVTVASVDPSGTAADSGIRKGDIIIEAQQTPVFEPDQALLILGAQSRQKHRFAAVLVEHDKKLNWLSLAVPD